MKNWGNDATASVKGCFRKEVAGRVATMALTQLLPQLQWDGIERNRWEDRTLQDKTRQDTTQARQDKTRQDKARQDKARQTPHGDWGHP